MKNLIRSIVISIFTGAILFFVSCTKDLLDREPTVDLGASAFWQTEEDATYALQGVYSSVRPLFDRDYYFDGHGEYVRVRSGSNSTNANNTIAGLRQGYAYRADNYNPSGYAANHNNMYEYLFGGINRANYLIENVTAMLDGASESSKANLETIIGETRLLRGMCYFKLISMWGDVPLIDWLVKDNSEVVDISRTPMAQIKDFIMEDFTYAFEKLPVSTTTVGRAAKPAALAFRGKLQLYWACWNNFGWPELENLHKEGTPERFVPSAAAAQQAYAAAAADFKSVIDDYGLELYMKGEPGECDVPGKADKLPNYYYLFTPEANGDPEHIMVFTHGPTGYNQGEELMRDFAGRNHEGSQCWVSPRYEIADRYQSIITGDFCEPLVPKNPANDADYFTATNSTLNPQSYANRDYRMKSSIQWNYERSIGSTSTVATGWCPFVYQSWNIPITDNPGDAGYYMDFPGLSIDDVGLTLYNTDGTNSGYVFRKFVRNKMGDGRSNGDFHWPVMRLADVYLMYAEAINEVNNGPDAKAIEVVNKIRHRGNLPALAADKTASKAAFFDAVEQERIIELLAEGHRGFDLRRWRAIERVWCPPNSDGIWRRDTHGADRTRYFHNAKEIDYQRIYIWKIPEKERNKNSNLTQNVPHL